MKKQVVPTIACAAFAVAGVAHGDIFFFLDEAEFQVALNEAGKVLEGFEAFPWTGFGVIGVDDPLDVNTSVPGWIKPGILLDNVTYQSNLDPFGANGPNPSGAEGLALFTNPFPGPTHNGVVANHFVDSFDILSGVPEPVNHTAMALQLVSFNSSPGGSSVTVSVYDKDNNLMGQKPGISAPADQGGAFLGILSTGGETIGRINIYDTQAGFDAEGLYTIGVYVPAPGTVFLLGLVGLGGTRRRRARPPRVVVNTIHTAGIAPRRSSGL